MALFWLILDAVAFFSGFVTGHVVAPPSAETEFFSVSAQIIPVLVLTLALEQRAFRATQIPAPPGISPGLETFFFWGRVFYQSAVLLLLGVTELVTLVPLMKGNHPPADPGPVLAVMAGCGALIAVRALRADLAPLSSPRTPEPAGGDPEPRPERGDSRARREKRRKR